MNMKDEENLPPCPFHGAACETAIEVIPFDRMKFFRVCWDCGAGGPEHSNREDAISDASSDNIVKLPEGVQRIAVERARQITAEKWTAEHDDSHDDNSLVCAAICYATPPSERALMVFDDLKWPWAPHWWKPSPENRIRELEKAGALIAAEIDRLSRKET